jgi:hypothetical protein
MLQTWIDSRRNIQVVQRTVATSVEDSDTPDGMKDLVEIEVAEDSTGLLTIFVRQLEGGLDPVAVKFVGPNDPPLTRQADTTILAALALAAQQYADPTPCYEAIKELRPDTDWGDWIADVERAREDRVAQRER